MLEGDYMKPAMPRPNVIGEIFVDAAEAAFVLNLPRYYLTNLAVRTKLRVPHYRIGRMVRFKLSELTHWQQTSNTHTEKNNA